MENSENTNRVMSRRTFFTWGAGLFSGLIAAVIGIPMVGSLFNSKSSSKREFVEVADLESIPPNEPKRIFFSQMVKDAFMVEPSTSEVWVVKHSDSNVTVFSPICPHLGCSYNWQPTLDEFVCPCHGSIFSMDGRVLGGPAPRGLDTLPIKIENGKLYLKWERFEVGIPEKKVI